MGAPDGDEAVFRLRMGRVANGQGAFVAKDRGRFLETHAMLLCVRRRFLTVPLKRQWHGRFVRIGIELLAGGLKADKRKAAARLLVLGCFVIC